MKIVYYCFGRAHSSVIAGNLHLGRLPMDRLASMDEIMNTPEFDQADREDRGIPFWLGKDSAGNDVYILGLANQRQLGLQAIFYILHNRVDLREWKFINTLQTINWTTRIGGFTSRTLKMVFPGRWIVTKGIQSSYWRLVKLVRGVKELSADGET
jgi:hypothetical protein